MPWRQELAGGPDFDSQIFIPVTTFIKSYGGRAKRQHILGQFLIEAVLLCNVGGVFGVLVGFGLGNVVTLFTDFAVDAPMEWAVAGVVFCTAVGLSFGLWPAVKASKLNPIDALRYE